MQTSDRGLVSRFGSSRSNLIALITLVAAIGFTPWAWGTSVPWAQFAFRTLGLTALFAFSLGYSSSPFARSAWGRRVTLSFAALVLATALSAALSIHRGKSLESMLNLLAISGLFLTAAALVHGPRLLQGIALLEVLAAIPVAVLGLLQHFRPELVPAGNSYPGRALGPFGQPNRMGGYLIASIPLALALAFAAQDRLLRIGLLAATFVLVMCLVATYSRGAWIGLGAGLITLAAALSIWPGLLPRPALAIAAVACVLAPAILLLPSVLSRIHSQPATQPAWNLPIDPEREGSGAMRRAIWSGALAATLHRPILGSGVGAFREAFDRYKNPRMKELEAEGGRTADQAHNHYLGILAERGVLGLAAFALLVALCFGAAAAAMASGTPAMGRVLYAGLAASVVALLAHGLTEDNLVLIPHGTIFFANLGVLAGAPARIARAGRSSRWVGSGGAVLASIAFLVSAAGFAGSREAAAASLEASAGRPDLAVRSLDHASVWAPWRDDYAVARAEQAEAWAKQGAGNAALREAEASYRHAIALNGSDPVTRHELARLYLANPDVFASRGTEGALRQLRAALDQNPYYAEIRNDLGVALLRTGDRSGAEDAFRRAASGKRDFVDPLLNLAAMALQTGNRGQAETWVRQALERNPGSERARALMARVGRSD